MKYLSICSGIESAGVGWHPLGYECIGLAEIDPFRSAVLQYHYPEITNYEDFTKIQASDLSATPDVLVGGTPCATFSIAGLRKGLAEDRGNLALEFVKLIERLQPTWVVWENVPGILSSNGGQDLGTFLGALGELRYGFAYRVLNTEHVRTQRFPNAIPQRRRRIFVVGHIGGDWRSPAKVLFDSAPVREDAPPSRRKREENPEKPTYRSARSDQLVEDEVAGTIAARDYKSATDLVVEKKPVIMRDSQTGSNGKPWNDEGVSWSLTAHDRYTVIETSTPDKAPRIYKEEVSPTLTAMTGGNRQPIVFIEKDVQDKDNSLIHCGDEVEMVRVRKHEVDIQGLQKSLKDGKVNKSLTIQNIADSLSVNKTTVDHWFRTDGSFAIPTEDVWFDLKSLLGIETDKFDDSIMEFEIREGTYEMSRRVYSDEGVSPTITASNPDAKITTRNDVIRRLTPVECERLQGLPDNYTQIPYRGKPKEDCPVSKRYEACGRAMSVNVMEWLGSRIKQVHNGEM